MARKVYLSVMTLVLCCFTQAGWAEEKPAADNPDFANWAKFKPGSSVTMQAKSPGPGGMAVVTTTVTRLVELGPDQCIVETTTEMAMGAGAPIKSPADKQPVTKKLPADETRKEVGAEDVTLLGKVYKCKVYEVSKKIGDRVYTSKAWITPEIPGGIVKTVVKAGAEDVVVTVTAFEVK